MARRVDLSPPRTGYAEIALADSLHQQADEIALQIMLRLSPVASSASHPGFLGKLKGK
jgi:hypothetical protein